MPFLDSCQTQFFTVFHSDFPFSRAAITKTELKSKPQPRETKPHSRRGEMKRTKHRWSEALEWLQLISISFQALIWAESSILSLEQEPESKPPFPGTIPLVLHLPLYSGFSGLLCWCVCTGFHATRGTRMTHSAMRSALSVTASPSLVSLSWKRDAASPPDR